MKATDNRISTFLHCKQCVEEIPEGIAPRDWARLEIGWTPKGLQVWCTRHECNVVALDFLGQKVGLDAAGPHLELVQ